MVILSYSYLENKSFKIFQFKQKARFQGACTKDSDCWSDLLCSSSKKCLSIFDYKIIISKLFYIF
jgi:hypothetical protein